jgi:hypothetical protein
MLTNITQRIENNKLILEVDITKEHGPSNTGKTIKVATSHGFESTGANGIAFSLNVNKTNRSE